MEKEKLNHLDNNSIGRTRGKRYTHDTYYSHQDASMEEFCKSMWPDDTQPMQGHSPEHMNMESRKWKVVEIKAGPIKSHWDSMVRVSEKLTSKTQEQELIDEQNERERDEFIN